MKFLDSTNAEQELDCKESNKFTGSSEKIHSEEHVASETRMSEESNEGYSALQPCSTEPTSTLQDKIAPLEGKPYFTIIMGETNVNRQFILKFPNSFLEFLPSPLIWAVLCCREKEWVVKCGGRHNKKVIRQGWKEFVLDNNLRIGDGCVFELLDYGEMKFRVQILTGEVPVGAGATDGSDAENPIVIE